MKIFFTCLLSALTLLVLGLFIARPIAPVVASPAIASTPTPACKILGTVGTVIIATCTDEDNGTVIYANSAGYMELKP